MAYNLCPISFSFSLRYLHETCFDFMFICFPLSDICGHIFKFTFRKIVSSPGLPPELEKETIHP